jgi:amphi-Trp domain-containing protein
MADRDVERVKSKAKFVSTLRRVADSIEAGEPVRIQVAAKRFVVPPSAALSIEHEASGGEEELELQLKWTTAPAAGRKVAARKGKRPPRSA